MLSTTFAIPAPASSTARVHSRKSVPRNTPDSRDQPTVASGRPPARRYSASAHGPSTTRASTHRQTDAVAGSAPASATRMPVQARTEAPATRRRAECGSGVVRTFTRSTIPAATAKLQ
ncbi:hypothetical protein DMP15_15625 [Pseudonocardia sp. UM4_GMWB1]